jgi:hypothetical protein
VWRWHCRSLRNNNSRDPELVVRQVLVVPQLVESALEQLPLESSQLRL